MHWELQNDRCGSSIAINCVDVDVIHLGNAIAEGSWKEMQQHLELSLAELEVVLSRFRRIAALLALPD